MTPRATFVIPAYNAEAYLAQAILSCRGQSVKEIEILVVDDGSDDGTRELIEWHASEDKRVRYASYGENRGRSAARNYGNILARSPIILVLDADDIALKNRVRDTLIHFNMKNADVLYGPFQIIDENDNVIGTQAAGPFNKEVSLKKKKNYIGHSTMAYRKGITLNVQYDEGDFSRLGLDDWKFQWDAYMKGYKFGFTKTTLSRYRIYQLADGQYGSPTEFGRNPEEVEKVKDAYIAEISSDSTVKV
jgi:glycosyltransferase involved in cell wall biosynthesis